MTKTDKANPNFFEEGAVDPVAAATGERHQAAESQENATQAKRKAGFYLSQDLLDRFNTRFYELKLSGAPIENKSIFLERALEFALDDLEKGEAGTLLAQIRKH